MLLQCQRTPQLLSTAAGAGSMREVDALKPALAFLTHCLQLPVSEADVAAVRPACVCLCICPFPCMLSCRTHRI